AVTGLNVFGSVRCATARRPPGVPISARDTRSSSASLPPHAPPVDTATSASSSATAHTSHAHGSPVVDDEPRLAEAPASVKGIRLPVVQQKHRTQSNSRQQHPPVRDEYVVTLCSREHVAPARYRLADAKTEERQRHLGDDVLRDEHTRLREDDAGGIRQDV